MKTSRNPTVGTAKRKPWTHHHHHDFAQQSPIRVSSVVLSLQGVGLLWPPGPWSFSEVCPYLLNWKARGEGNWGTLSEMAKGPFTGLPLFFTKSRSRILIWNSPISWKPDTCLWKFFSNAGSRALVLPVCIFSAALQDRALRHCVRKEEHSVVNHSAFWPLILQKCL